MRQLAKFVPAFGWLPAYDKANLRSDAVAGLTTAVMLVPQGMAYAMLAGLPPIIGLYASAFPLVVYSLFGTSRQLAVGPVAMVSLLVASGVATVAEPGSAEFVAMAVLLSLMVGVIQLGMGLARLGFLVNFLSHPVVSGFTSAAALIIGLSQLKHLLGFNIPRSHHVHEILIQAGTRIGETKPETFAIGAGAVVLLVVLKKVAPAFPRALAVVVLGSLAVLGLGLGDGAVAIVGEVPAGLPPFALPALEMDAVGKLLPTAFAISFVGFMESISVAAAFARRNRYEVDANKELVALGAANVVGGFFKAYPVTGGFSRTAVNAQAGAKTPLASLITSGVVIVALLFLTPLFYYLPKAVLAAIIMTAVFGLIDVAEVRHLWQVKRSDLALLGTTFFATLLLGIEEGILVGVGASLGLLVLRTTRPHVAVLGRRPNGIYRNVDRFDDAEPHPGVLAVRLDAQFYFGNVNFLKETLRDLEHDSKQAPIRAVVIDASGMNQIDSSAASALHEVFEDYQRRGIVFHVANLKGPVLDVLARAHFLEHIGTERIFDRIEEAVEAAVAAISDDATGAAPEAPASPGARAHTESTSRSTMETPHADQAVLR